jgi:hypothetical protein
MSVIIRLVADLGNEDKELFRYESSCVPRIGDEVALTVDDEGFMTAEVIGVLHIPQKAPLPAQAQVAIDALTDPAITFWCENWKPT